MPGKLWYEITIDEQIARVERIDEADHPCDLRVVGIEAVVIDVELIHESANRQIEKYLLDQPWPAHPLVSQLQKQC